jgi:hypothetical protein
MIGSQRNTKSILRPHSARTGPGAEVVDALDMDAAILHRFNIIRDLDDLARGRAVLRQCESFASRAKREHGL